MLVLGIPPWDDYDVETDQLTVIESETAIVVIDLSDPANPTIASDTRFSFDFDSRRWTGVDGAGQTVVRVGGHLVLQDTHHTDASDRVNYHVLDIGALSDIGHLHTIQGPAVLGTAALHVYGSEVMGSHWAAVPGSTNRVRYFVDRFDPRDPAGLVSINVPGTLLRYDPVSRHALTLDSQDRYETIAYDECLESSTGVWDSVLEQCVRYEMNLHLVALGNGGATLLDTEPYPQQQSTTLFRSNTRLFFVLGTPVRVDYCVLYGSCAPSVEASALGVVGDISGDELAFHLHELPNLVGPTVAVADESRLIVGGAMDAPLLVLDAADPASIIVSELAPLLADAEHLTLDESRAHVSVGYDGVQTIELE